MLYETEMFEQLEEKLVAEASDIDFEADLFICLAIGPDNVSFTHFETCRDEEGEITQWVYTISPDQSFVGNVTVTEVIIFND